MKRCACGRSVEQPWRQRDTPVSPASFLAGLLLLGFGVAAVVVPESPHPVGWGVLGVLGLAAVVGWGTSLARGHLHPGCVLGRGLWLGLAWPGLPLRVVLSLPF
ncbi:hypothetical protein [Nocardioides sp. WS12]|uniref:hypothetical protein n=1 Tax=Nocardioides sp. WS12 TaxID=2486272 RepID=UPI0015FA1409|nr:hypothetical protein [Nocardioides sp. WS12]